MRWHESRGCRECNACHKCSWWHTVGGWWVGGWWGQGGNGIALTWAEVGSRFAGEKEKRVVPWFLACIQFGALAWKSLHHRRGSETAHGGHSVRHCISQRSCHPTTFAPPPPTALMRLLHRRTPALYSHRRAHPTPVWRPENCSAGGGGVGEMGFRVGPFVFCKNGCWRQRRRNTNFGPKKFFPPIIPPPPHLSSQNDQRDVGIILSHRCWVDPPPPGMAGRAPPP